MLSSIEKTNILSTFPANIKLSYEKEIYKKVSQMDYIVAIPYGKTCFAWFTYLNKKEVCLILEIANGNIIDVNIFYANFNHELSYGTILYGTLFYQNKHFFSVEDIFFFKGNAIKQICWGEKLTKICQILKTDLNLDTHNKTSIIFGHPLIAKTNEEIERKIQQVNYKIDRLQFKLFNKINSCLTINIINYKNFKISKKSTEKCYIPKNINKTEVVFNIRPSIQADIYYLYCNDNKMIEKEYGVAIIPDYKTSVMMNRLFRIIKENENLDKLEESDDEEEFENENVGKFVYLDKSYKMICNFNSKFKKWVPIRVADENSDIVKECEIKFY